jgi:hypothetical protein
MTVHLGNITPFPSISAVILFVVLWNYLMKRKKIHIYVFFSFSSIRNFPGNVIINIITLAGKLRINSFQQKECRMSRNNLE